MSKISVSISAEIEMDEEPREGEVLLYKGLALKVVEVDSPQVYLEELT